MTFPAVVCQAPAISVDCFELYHDMQMVRRRRQTACARQRLAKSIVRHSPLSPYATAPVASVADPKAFRSGWDFSAWIRLVLAVADLRSAKSLFTKVQSWFSSTHILDHNESVPNEPHRYTLRLRPCRGFPVGVTVALSCLR